MLHLRAAVVQAERVRQERFGAAQGRGKSLEYRHLFASHHAIPQNTQRFRQALGWIGDSLFFVG